MMKENLLAKVSIIINHSSLANKFIFFIENKFFLYYDYACEDRNLYSESVSVIRQHSLCGSGRFKRASHGEKGQNVNFLYKGGLR